MSRDPAIVSSAMMFVIVCEIASVETTYICIALTVLALADMFYRICVQGSPEEDVQCWRPSPQRFTPDLLFRHGIDVGFCGFVAVGLSVQFALLEPTLWFPIIVIMLITIGRIVHAICVDFVCAEPWRRIDGMGFLWLSTGIWLASTVILSAIGIWSAVQVNVLRTFALHLIWMTPVVTILQLIFFSLHVKVDPLTLIYVPFVSYILPSLMLAFARTADVNSGVLIYGISMLVIDALQHITAIWYAYLIYASM